MHAGACVYTLACVWKTSVSSHTYSSPDIYTYIDIQTCTVFTCVPVPVHEHVICICTCIFAFRTCICIRICVRICTYVYINRHTWMQKSIYVCVNVCTLVFIFFLFVSSSAFLLALPACSF